MMTCRIHQRPHQPASTVATHNGHFLGITEPNLDFKHHHVRRQAREAVERAVGMAKDKGAKRALLLPVSAPFHCALMQPAADVMAAALAEAEKELAAVQREQKEAAAAAAQKLKQTQDANAKAMAKARADFDARMSQAKATMEASSTAIQRQLKVRLDACTSSKAEQAKALAQGAESVSLYSSDPKVTAAE